MSREQFEAVNAAVTARQVAEWLGLSVNRAGFISSPFHEERTPSCKLYEHSFHDFSTSQGGDSIMLAAVVLGVGNWEACKQIASAFNIPIVEKPADEIRRLLEERKRARARQQEEESLLQLRWRRVVDSLKAEGEIYDWALDHKIFLPLSGWHARLISTKQMIDYKLDILCTGSESEWKALLQAERR